MDSIWDVQVSGNDIIWNLTAPLSYPSFSVDKFLNITTMPDWSAEDIYNGSSATGEGTFTSYSGLVACYDMTNGTWTLRSDGPNYLTAMDISNNAGGAPLPTMASILTSLDVNTTVEDGSSNPATTGSTNFTVLNSTTVVWTNLQAVSAGSTTHLWDIDATTTKNGTYTLDLFWYNGTEAGYLSQQYVVYLPTTFVADESSINGYTENTVSISVTFEDSYTSIGLNSTYAAVVYSFDGEANVTMDDILLNGTWTKTISTANRIPGTHTIDVYAEGTAIQNQSLSISVELIHQTQALTVQWTNTDTITFTGTTTLQVLYRNATTFEDITTATVNVTDGTTTWLLKWNVTSSYFEIQFNGSDANPGIGVHSLTINAWQSGYLAQSDATQTLTIDIEPTGGNPLWMNANIEWTDSITLRLNYTDSGSNLISVANQQDIYINGSWYPLSGGGNGTYWYIFDNTLGLGYFEIYTNISKDGYDPWVQSGITLTISEETTDWVITWEPANVTLPYTHSLNLTVTYTYSGVDVPSSAVVNVTIDSQPYTLNWTGSSWYGSIPGDYIGVGVWSATILADLHGYQSQSNITSNVNITLAANSFVISPNSDTSITYAEQIEITVTYTYEFNPILGATVRIIVNDTTTLIPTYNAGDEMWHYTLTGVDADLGLWNITVVANKTGYDTGIDQFYLTVNLDNPVITPSWSILSAEYIYDIPLSINITASTLAFLDSATVTVEINTTPRVVTNHGNGTYTTFFDRSMDLALYTINISVSEYGYLESYVILTLTIIDAQTELVLSVSDYDPYYDENSIITLRYQLLNTTMVTPSNITFELDGVNQTLTWNVDHWEISYVAANLGLGQHTCEINTSAYGYANKTQIIIIEVLEIPTSFDILGVDSMYVNDTITLRLTYTDTRTSTALLLDALIVGWDGSYLLSPGTGDAYDLVLNSSGLHMGSFDLDLQLIQIGYGSIINQTEITVLPVTTSIITAFSRQIYENETIVIVAALNDTYHNSWIHWATVTIELDDQNYTMLYDELNEEYYIEIWMDHEVFAARNHVATIFADALDSTSSLAPVVITVLDKTDYVLSIDSDPIVNTGTDLGVHITVLVGGNPEGLVSVRVHAILTLNETQTEEVVTVRTNDDGLATASFSIPEGTTLVEVWAEIIGTAESWYVSTSSISVTAQPPSDIFTLLVAFVLSPTGIFLLMIGLIVVAIVAGYTRKLKPSRLAARGVLDQQLRTFRDLDSMQHFMAVYVDRGTCVFYHPFRSARIQADLISGFISAVTSVYGEIKGDGVQGTLEEIHYQGLRLNSYSGQYVLGILILEKEISTRLRGRLQFFVEMFENEYESHLKGWTGIVDCFDPEWIVSNLMATFGYSWVVPHTIDDSVKMTGTEKKIIGYVKASLGEKLEREFEISEYLQPIARMQKKSEAEALDIFLRMEDKGIIQPISVHTILLRQGLGLSGVDELVEEFADASEIVKDPIPEEPTLDEEVETAVEEPKTPKKKKKKKSEVETPKEEPKEEEPEPEKEADPRDKFLEDVESLLKKEKEDGDDEKSD
ncbi:MAG: hypothetical protein ACW98Y_11340 [Candidatus Thorarchaeota archaeon]|jgi:hypothetical protein